MDSFKHIIERWPTRAALAIDVGVPPLSARAWHRRDSIPPEYWVRLVTAARARGFTDVSYELLSAIADMKRAA